MITPYFDSLFDDFGIWQHTDGSTPILKEGYALDDATRGLLLCLSLGRTKQATILFNYIVNSRCGDEFYGFATDKRKFITSPASEDAKGQIVWALGYAVSLGFNKNIALDLINGMVPNLLNMESLRGFTYSLLGAIYFDEILAKMLIKELTKRFDNTTNEWPWPEDKLTYGNGIIPYAILRYALLFNDKNATTLGLKILNFLELCCTKERIRGPIGNDGWFPKNSLAPAVYSQQPIDSAYMAWAWICAYQLSGDQNDLRNAKLWMLWFEGKNISGSLMYDSETLKAFDGINKIGADHSNEYGVNFHSGAETNICFLLSRWMIQTETTI